MLPQFNSKTKTIAQRKRAFFIITFAMLVSQIGSGLTQIAALGALSNLGADSFSFAVAFSFAFLPAIVSSKFAELLLKKYTLTSSLALSQIIGALGVLLPWYGLKHNSIILIQLSELFSSFSIGMCFPILQLLTSRSFEPKDLARASRIESFAFATSVVIGTIMGALMFAKIGPRLYIMADFISFTLSLLLIILAKALFPIVNKARKDHLDKNNPHAHDNLPACSPTEKAEKRYLVAWLKSLQESQRRAFFLQIALTAGTIPGSALLAYIGSKSAEKSEFVSFGLNAGVALLIGKTLGQMLSPLVLKDQWISNLSNKNCALPLILGFNLMYFSASMAGSLLVSILLIFVAHVFSNILYTVCSYSFQVQFPEEQIVEASGRQYRLTMILSSSLPLASGLLTKSLPIYSSLLFGIGLGCFALLLERYLSKRSLFAARAIEVTNAS